MRQFYPFGLKLAEPDRAVVTTAGDAGLATFLGELAIPSLVFLDTQLGLTELEQRGSQLPGLAVDFGATDFPAVAGALGGDGVSVRG